MDDLKTMSKLVKRILETDPQTRNSDSFLYLAVVRHYAKVNGFYSIEKIPVTVFLEHMGLGGSHLLKASDGHARRFKRNILNWQLAKRCLICVAKKKRNTGPLPLVMHDGWNQCWNKSPHGPLLWRQGHWTAPGYGNGI